ncbi:MAG: CapA family protein, partial [Myxococcota bacterium]
MGRWLGWWILFGACGSPPAAPPEPIREPVPAPDVEAADEPATVLWIGGDVLLSEAIRDYAQLSDDPAQGMASILAPMAARWQRDEGAFVLVNLETPVANRRRYALNAEPTNPHGYTAVHLHGPRWLLPALAQTGIDAVSLANNHALDQDREGLGETIRNAKEAGLLVTGAGVYPRERWPLVLGDERTMAVVALYDGRGRGYVEDGDPALSFLDDDSFTLVEALDAEHDAVVVTVHVLGELVDEP